MGGVVHLGPRTVGMRRGDGSQSLLVDGDLIISRQRRRFVGTARQDQRGIGIGCRINGMGGIANDTCRVNGNGLGLLYRDRAAIGAVVKHHLGVDQQFLGKSENTAPIDGLTLIGNTLDDTIAAVFAFGDDNVALQKIVTAVFCIRLAQIRANTVDAAHNTARNMIQGIIGRYSRYSKIYGDSTAIDGGINHTIVIYTACNTTCISVVTRDIQRRLTHAIANSRVRHCTRSN